LVLVLAHGFFDAADAAFSLGILNVRVWSARGKLNLVVATPREQRLTHELIVRPDELERDLASCNIRFHVLEERNAGLGVSREGHTDTAVIVGEKKSIGVSANRRARESAQAIDVKAFAIVNVRAARKGRMRLVSGRPTHGTGDAEGAWAIHHPLGESVELGAMRIRGIHGESNFEHAIAVRVAIRAVDPVPAVKVAQKARSEVRLGFTWRRAGGGGVQDRIGGRRLGVGGRIRQLPRVESRVQG